MDRIWWEQITNSRRLIEEVGGALVCGQSVFLGLPRGVPWYDTMQRMIADYVQMQQGMRAIRIIHPKELGNTKPGEYLWRNFCSEELRAKYRPAIGYAKFLAGAETSTLSQHYIWIQKSDESTTQAWLDFIYAYQEEIKNENAGNQTAFILEIDEDLLPPDAKAIKTVSYSRLIQPYDGFVFSMLIASNLSGNEYKKKYLGELLTGIADGDAELSAACLEGTAKQKILREPWNVLCHISEQKVRSNGTPFHLLKTKDEVDTAVWMAQLKIVFPIIEGYRKIFIEKHEPSLQSLLPYKDKMGYLVADVGEVEIGQLHYWASTAQLQVKDKERETLCVFRDARNRLAHLKQLTMDELDTIFFRAS